MSGIPRILHDIAHGRSGDKGDRLNVSVIAYQAMDYPILLAQLTEARIAALFADRHPTAVRRYELPRLGALNFVIDGVLDGGVNQSLNLDGHGKSLSSRVLGLTIDLSAGRAGTSDLKEEETT
ncbi:AtuA-related protein [Limimaricola cinnabarinus]|uniref:AtuA-related protein n=1 Tax=Limimaricola cinnabarinus TaxID=1125964 RepID=UPI002493AAA0|nr:hypothetical protein [Limimaricola cinnabarinus]